jgi:hypothetical protein
MAVGDATWRGATRRTPDAALGESTRRAQLERFAWTLARGSVDAMTRISNVQRTFAREYVAVALAGIAAKK